MINLNGLSKDFTEVIARMLLRQEMVLQGDPMPITDHWRDLYLNGYVGPSRTAMDTLRYNRFRAEVDAIVHLLINHTMSNMD